MTIIKSITRSNVSELRKAYQDAIDAVSAKYGLSADLGRITYSRDGDEMRCKLTVNTIVGSDSSNVSADEFLGLPVTDSEEAQFAAAKIKYSLTDLLSNKLVIIGGRKMTIVGYKANRPKFPFVVQGPQGGRYKVTIDQIRRAGVK